MTTFLFWNLHRNVSAPLVAQLALEHSADVVILAEVGFNDASLLLALNEKRTEYEFVPLIGCDKIRIFTRFPERFLRPLVGEPRFTISRLDLPGLETVLLVSVHLSDKRNTSEKSQQFRFTELSRTIREVEGREGHDRTLLLGDFNVNPFESGMVAAEGLHAVSTRQRAQSGARTVESQSYPFFYNPMWNFFGDATSGPPGTYHYTRSESVCYFWNIFDQVLVIDLIACGV